MAEPPIPSVTSDLVTSSPPTGRADSVGRKFWRLGLWTTLALIGVLVMLLAVATASTFNQGY